jgi:hypothetical protein
LLVLEKKCEADCCPITHHTIYQFSLQSTEHHFVLSKQSSTSRYYLSSAAMLSLSSMSQQQEALSPNVAANRPTWLRLLPVASEIPPFNRLHDRENFRQFCVSVLFNNACTGDPTLRPCIRNHQRDGNVFTWLIRGQRPSVQYSFEALHLADMTIEFFSRELMSFSPKQRAALKEFEERRHDLVDALNQANCSIVLLPCDMVSLIKMLDQIFFMGALSPNVSFSWDDQDFENATEEHFGYCQSRPDSRGGTCHSIFLHPTNVLDQPRGTLAAARIGVLLHEMLHGMFFALGCRRCAAAVENLGMPIEGHGRAWHRVAKALEGAASELLGIPYIDLGRLDTLKMWYVDPRDRRTRFLSDSELGVMIRCNPSLHDLTRYGFL